MTIQLDANEISNIEDVLYAVDDNADISTDYSGRGMMGDRCFGITFDSGAGNLFQFALRLGREHPDLAEKFDRAGTPRQDSMGRGTIFYWERLEPALRKLVPEGDGFDHDEWDEEWDEEG